MCCNLGAIVELEYGTVISDRWSCMTSELDQLGEAICRDSREMTLRLVGRCSSQRLAAAPGRGKRWLTPRDKSCYKRRKDLGVEQAVMEMGEILFPAAMVF